MNFDLKSYRERLEKLTQALKDRLPETPEVALVLGSGLGGMVDQLEEPISLPYSELPGCPVSTAPGHAGRFLYGKIGGKRVLAMQGRFHYYEGWQMEEVILPIRVFAKLGIETLILTNAAGGVQPHLKPGTFLFLKDHIGLFCPSPLRGPNLEECGPRFPDCSKIYTPELLEIALKTADQLGIPVETGVYAYAQGPNYETPSDVKLLAQLGADAVGMSTVPEAQCAAHCGLRVLALSCITNLAAGILDQPLNHEEVMEVGRQVSADSIRLMTAILEAL